MSNSDINVQIELIKKLLVEKYHPQKIVLFGSFAWGSPGKDSNIDLLVIKNVSEPRPKREQIIYRLFSQYLKDRKYPIDVIVHTNDETQEKLKLGDPFISEVLKRGTVLYER